MLYFIALIAVLGYLVVQFGFGFLATIGVFLGVLLFLVVAHELGHFTVAKLANIKVLEFGVGMPPRAWGIRRGETEYTVNWLPLGGFVRMLGEEDPTHPRSFARQAAWKRLAVLAAGAGVNAVLPVILLAIALMIPRQVLVTDVTVMSVADGSPAAEAGVQPGDVISEAAGRDIENSAALTSAIQLRLGADMVWIVERDWQLVELRILEVRVDPPAGQGATGISMVDARVTVDAIDPGSPADATGLRAGDLFLRVGQSIILDAPDLQSAIVAALGSEPGGPVPIQVLRDGSIVELSAPPSEDTLDGLAVSVRPEESQSASFFEAVPGAFAQLWEILVSFRNEISRWISSGTGVELAGPVGIAQLTGRVVEAGLGPLVTWTALLSINLAVVNILPIPALDGGRIMFVLIELIRGGRRISPEKERIAHMIGFAVLMATILLVTANDIQRLFEGGSLFG